MEYSFIDITIVLIGGLFFGYLLGLLEFTRFYLLPKKDWQCTASHHEGPEHDQHDDCDQYARKNKQ